MPIAPCPDCDSTHAEHYDGCTYVDGCPHCEFHGPEAEHTDCPLAPARARCCGALAADCDCDVVAHGYHDERHPDCPLCTTPRRSPR